MYIIFKLCHIELPIHIHRYIIYILNNCSRDNSVASPDNSMPY